MVPTRHTQKTDNNIYGQGSGDIGSPIYCCGKHKMRHCAKQSCSYSRTKCRVSDPEIYLLAIHLR